MNKVMSNNTFYTSDVLRFYPQTFCTVSTVEGSILECQLDLYVHELTDSLNGITMKAYKPITHEVEVSGVMEHINSIFVPQLDSEDYLCK